MACGVIHTGNAGSLDICRREKGHIGPHHRGNGVVIEHTLADPSTRIMLANGLHFVCPESRRLYVQTILSGARYLPWVAEWIMHCKRILDVGCGEGAFAAYVWSVNPRAWVDAVESDAALRRFAEINAPPGTDIVADISELKGPWDLIRWGSKNAQTTTCDAVELFDFCSGRKP